MLNEAERNMSAWIKIEKHLDERIETLRKKNEKIGLGKDETEGIRRTLEELRRLKNFGRPTEPPKMTHKDPYMGSSNA